jgi:hypothetical protein
MLLALVHQVIVIYTCKTANLNYKTIMLTMWLWKVFIEDIWIFDHHSSHLIVSILILLLVLWRNIVKCVKQFCVVSQILLLFIFFVYNAIYWIRLKNVIGAINVVVGALTFHSYKFWTELVWQALNRSAPVFNSL